MNPKVLIEYLTTYVNKKIYDTFYGGYVVIAEPVRDKEYLHYISKDQYPYTKYPPYVSGNFFILSPKTAMLFYNASKRIKLHKFDDVYMGMLALALGIKPTFIDRVYPTKINFDSHRFANEVISMHKILKNDLFDIWKKIENFNLLDPNYLKNCIEQFLNNDQRKKI